MASDKPIIILGAGPSGLTAAWLLTRHNKGEVIVVEGDPQCVGGQARTHLFDEYRIDIGGHYFASKSGEIREIWQKIMPHELMTIELNSHLVHHGKYYVYPFRLLDILLKVGPFEIITILFSYLQSLIFPKRPEKSFFEWLSNRFGKHVYEHVCKEYYEKIMGAPCHQISTQWGEQTLYNLTLKQLIQDLISGKKTIASSIFYPRLGPGQMWEKASEQIQASGGKIMVDFKVQTVHWDEEGVSHVTGTSSQGAFYQLEGSHFISSLPLGDLILSMDPPPPQPVEEAARQLRYRSLITVVMVVNQSKVTSDTFIYVNNPEIKTTRILNYKNLSPSMVANKSLTTLGLEYHCFENDDFWSKSDDALAEVAAKEIVDLKLVKSTDLVQAFVLRTARACPFFNQDYDVHVKTIKEWLDYFPNLHPVGRNGLHCFSYQDKSMMTAVLAVKNVEANDRIYDCWCVTPDAEYKAPKN